MGKSIDTVTPESRSALSRRKIWDKRPASDIGCPEFLLPALSRQTSAAWSSL